VGQADPSFPLLQRRFVAWGVAVVPIVLASAYIFAPVLDDDWILYDNNKMIHRHPGITGGTLQDIFGLEGYRRLAVLYQPLVVVSMAVDYQLFGLEDKTGWAWHSLLLHLAVMILLLVLLYRLGGSLSAAGLGALLVAAHPLVVEPTTWIICRTFLLAGAWILIGTHLYLSYLDRPRRWLLLGQIACYGISMFAKPLLGIVLLPLWLDVWRRRRITAAVLAEKLPVLLIALGFVLLNVQAVGSQQGALQPLVHGWSELAGRMVQGTVWTLANTLAPMKLTIFYRYNGAWQVIAWRAWLVGAVVLGWAVVAAAAWRRFGREWFLCGLAWLILFLPQLGVLRYRNTLTADRYAYVPLWFIGLAAASVLAYLWRRSPGAGPIRRAVGVFGAVAATVLVVAEAHAARQYAKRWDDEVVLWKAVVTQTPGAIPYGELANVYLHRATRPGSTRQDRQGNLASAADALRKAAELEPRNFQVWGQLGAVYRALGRADEAIEALRRALTLCRRMGMPEHEPRLSRYWTDLGRAWLKKTRPVRAIDCFRRAVRCDARNYKALTWWGYALWMRGDVRQASAKCRAALAIQPRYAPAVRLASKLTAAGARGRDDRPGGSSQRRR